MRTSGIVVFDRTGTRARDVVTVACGFLLAACAAQGTRPDDMSAAEHRTEAKERAGQGEAHGARYDAEHRAHREVWHPDVGETGAGFFSREVYNPTAVHADHASEHRAHAEEHLAAARELEAFEVQECGMFPKETRAVCPLQGGVVAAEDLDVRPRPASLRPKGVPTRLAWRRGVRIAFVPGTNVEAVAAHMRCHIAFARTRARQGMDACPLYLDSRSLDVRRGADAGTVELTTSDPALLGELRRRTRRHVGP